MSRDTIVWDLISGQFASLTKRKVSISDLARIEQCINVCLMYRLNQAVNSLI